MKLLAALLALAPLQAQMVDLTVRVIDAVTLAPIPGAKVRLTPGDYSGTAGDDGTFTLKVPGHTEFRILEVEAENYSASHSGRAIGTGAASGTATIRLMRTGTLSGRIVDADSGAPLAGVAVEALRFAWVRGQPALQHASEPAITAGNGAFALAGLAPGPLALEINSYATNQRRAPLTGYPDLVWPGAGDLQGASPVRLPYGSNLNLGDIKLRKRALSKLTVAIDRGSCTAGKVYTVSLEQFSFSTLFRRAFSTAPCGGAATLSNITPGDYEISVDAERLPREHATVAVQIAQAEEKTTITVMPPIVIHGTVTADRDAQLPPNLGVNLWPRGSKQNGPFGHLPSHSARTNGGGTFETWSYIPAGGEIRVAATSLPPAYYIRELRYAGSAFPGDTFVIRAGPAEQDLTIVLSARAATVTGTVRTSDGAAVPGAGILLTLWPADIVSDYPFGVTETTADSSGGYTLAHLRPGTYRLIAVPAGARATLEEPGRMLALFQSAESFDLGGAASAVRQLEPVVR